MNERDKLIRTAIFDEIDVARKKDIEEWGHEFDDKNTPNDWVTFITRYLSVAADNSLSKCLQNHNGKPPLDPDKRYRINMLKAASIVMSAIEAFDRAQGTVRRHYE